MASENKKGFLSNMQDGDFKNFLKFLSTSGFSSAIAKTLVAPLERLKLIYQVIIFCSF